MSILSNDKEYLITQAFEMISSGASHHKASHLTGIPESTLRARESGSQNAKMAQSYAQILSSDQEDFLVNWILNEEKAGYASTK